jgi:hypothetical protein
MECRRLWNHRPRGISHYPGLAQCEARIGAEMTCGTAGVLSGSVPRLTEPGGRAHSARNTRGNHFTASGIERGIVTDGVSLAGGAVLDVD